MALRRGPRLGSAMAKRPKSNIPRYKRRRRGRSLSGRIVRLIVKLVLVFLIGSVLWVLAYRFVNPPITATMLGDIVAGRGRDARLDEHRRDRPRHGPRRHRRRGQQVLRT